MIDKIISPVILIITVIFFSIILYTTVFSGIESEQTLHKQQYQMEYSDLLIRSLFLAHENNSASTYELLLAKSLRDIQTTVFINGRSVDAKQAYRDALDQLVGPNNYYFDVKPAIKGLSISYILDGSDSMADKRAQVNASLPGMIASLRNDVLGPNATILVHLYMLTSLSNLHPCAGFSIPPNVTCEELSGDLFYQQLMNEGFRPPYPAPMRSYNEWLYSSHAAGPQDLSESDWASAVAYASYNYSHSEMERALTNKHVIITVADELTSNSKADECFSAFAKGDNTNLSICLLCNATCPLNRSLRIVNQTAAILQKNGDLFIGFHSFPCDLKYNTQLNDVPVTNYTCHYMDSPLACTKPPSVGPRGTPVTTGRLGLLAGINWCDQRACGACKAPAPPTGSYCFHSDCNQAVIDQLEELANRSNGATYDLANLSQLTTVVQDSFTQQINSFNFTIGVKNLTRERYIVERPLTLTTGERITLRFWVYT